MIVPEFFTVNFTLPAGTDDGVTVIVIGPFVPVVSPTSTATGVAGAAAPAVTAPVPATVMPSTAIVTRVASARLLVVDVLVRLTRTAFLEGRRFDPAAWELTVLSRMPAVSRAQ